jgi:hypothetical protein
MHRLGLIELAAVEQQQRRILQALRDIEMAIAMPRARGRKHAAQHPDCDILNGDIKADGAMNTLDIEPFVDLLTGP